ncbi:MAG: Hsp20/alpha crystallin family protein [Lachnospiraceae bacterium]|nr:Hsp20/alpha crystallin family protein [Lachnospiraceae bacterium]
MLMPSIFGENLFDDLFDDFARPMNVIRYANPTPSAMKTDVKETDAGYELDIDLPGYKKEDVKAELKDGYMTISAEKKSEDSEKDEKSGKYLRRERYYGSCSRSFYVGEDITEEDIKAKFEDGILKIAVPKKEPQPAVDQTKTIAIEG